jgi:hypothetical protein
MCVHMSTLWLFLWNNEQGQRDNVTVFLSAFVAEGLHDITAPYDV